MIFCCGIAVGFYLFGVGEPLYYYRQPVSWMKGWDYNLRKIQVNDDAQRANQSIFMCFFHWGVHGWIPYILMAVNVGIVSHKWGLPLTIRAVFIINPENKLMLSLNYPACVGRNMDEIVRCVQALQLSYEKSIATPANWPNNHQDLKDASGASLKGSVFLLPTVSPEEAEANYPGYHTCDVPSNKPYLRLVKSEMVGGPAPANPPLGCLKCLA